jgi:thermitase
LLNQRQLIASTIIVLLLTVIVLGGLWIVSQEITSNDLPLPTLARLSTNPTDTQPTSNPTEPVLIDSIENMPDTVLDGIQVARVVHKVEVQEEPIIGQHILEFADDMTATEISDYVEALDIQVVETLTELNRVVVVSDVRTIERIQAEAIVSTEPDYYASALLTLPPSDPYYPQQWNLPMIGAPALWDALSETPTSVRVAVIDSGVCFDHPDMPALYADFQYDYVENDAIPQDEYGHGCGVTGVIASQNNTIGTMGIAPFVEIMPLRVLNENGIGSYSNIARAIVDATNQGVAIINLSLGGLQSSNTLKSAVDYALEQGVIMIAAAGNSGGDTPLYPARYDGVIAVGSVNREAKISTFNHQGVELFAPGEDIIVPHINNGMVVSSGTSFAAPHITGIIALKLSIGRRFSPTDPIIAISPTGVAVDQDFSNDPDAPIVFGDILIPRKYATDGDEASALFTFGAFFISQWSNDIAYYSFDPAVSSLNRQRTREAMDQWEATSNIQFVPRTNESNYIYLQNGDGNNSYVGMIGGKQELNMYNWDYKYIIVHELGHALGLWHEQSRKDRDDYIFVDYDEIEDEYASQFNILAFAPTVGDYDFASVMHYYAYGFAKGNNPTIIVLPPNYDKWQNRIGDTAFLSEWDAIGMWAAYPCENETLDCITLPQNDIFEDALVIDDDSFTHSITGGYGTGIATTSVDDPFPSCAPYSAKAVWYKITVPSSQITINTNDSNYDRTLSIWTGGRGSYNEVACNSSGSLTFVPTLGTTYYAMVSGDYPSWGDLEADGGDLYFNFEAIPFCYPFDEWIQFTNPLAPACSPDAPSDFGAVAIAYQEKIDLDWEDNSTYETAFQIERRISGDSVWSVVDTVAGNITIYVDTTVACYTTYEYQVRAYRSDDTNYSDPSLVATAQSSCSTVTPPDNLVAISSLNVIQVGWDDNSPDETEFRVERSPYNTNTWAQVGTSPANSTTFTNNTGLICGSSYDYRVHAYRAGDTNDSADSNVLSMTLTCDPPTAPSNITVDDIVTITDLQIGWQDNSTTETAFVIERYISGTTWQHVTTVGAGIITAQDTDENLNCYTDYDYRVKSYRSHDSKESSYSSTATGMTSCDTLFAPDNLAVINTLNTIVTTWDNNSPDGTAFEIERSLTGEDTWLPLSTINAPTTTYSDNATVCGITYDYQVRQYRSNDSIYSAYSGIVTATQTCSPPTSPSSLTLEAIPLTRQITLSWLDNAFNETSYLIERSTDGENDNWTQITSISAGSTTYTDTDNILDCYTPYYYRVRAYRSTDDAYSQYSNSTNITAWCDPVAISSASFTDTSTTSDASNMFGFPFPTCGFNTNHVSVWEYNPTETMQLALNTFGSDFDTVLSIWLYNGTFTPIVCNDDSTLDGTSATVASVVVDQRYIIVVGGKNNTSGSINLNISQIFPATATPLPTQIPIPSETPTPNLTTVGLFANGVWLFRDSNTTGATDIVIRYGTQLGDGWQPVVGDWNGDGADGIGLYKEGRWFLRDMVGKAVTDEYSTMFGAHESGWQPVAGDWNGDGIDGIGLYKDSVWQLKNNLSDGDADYAFRFNVTSNTSANPIVGDWHNQAVDRVGLYENGTWFLSYDHRTSNNALIFGFGSTDGAWYPIVGDWDVDGDDTIGVYKDGAWRLRNTNSRGSTDLGFTFAGLEGVPISGYRGGAGALALLAMPSDISLSAPEPPTVPTSTHTPTDVIPTVTFSPQPTITPSATWTIEPSSTLTPTSEPLEIPDNASGT